MRQNGAIASLFFMTVGSSSAPSGSRKLVLRTCRAEPAAFASPLRGAHPLVTRTRTRHEAYTTHDASLGSGRASVLPGGAGSGDGGECEFELGPRGLRTRSRPKLQDAF